MQVDTALLYEYFAADDPKTNQADTPRELLERLNLERIPKHVSIIMDGNGRWAQARGKDRSQGHKAGVAALREAVTTSVRLGIDVLSVYAFSTENWKRPQAEVNLLMHLFATTLVRELPLFHQENVRLMFIGDLTQLPQATQDVFAQGLEETKHNTGMVFALAVNYGSRSEITRALKLCCKQVQDGTLAVNDITEDTIASKLYTAQLPDPDLLIRTSGEMRLSNYLLWQLAYSELYVTPVLWPDFSRWDYLRAVIAYQTRTRRFGGL